MNVRSAGSTGIVTAAVGLGLGLLALGPGLRRGFLLSYDMVFVPREPFAAAMPGLAPPRAVPSDLVVAAASRVLPADIVQKAVLLAIFVLACAGAAALLDREPLLPRLAAGVFYAWNPYVGERLIIGQWALLLGYAGLPWALRAVLAPDLASRRGAGRLGLALLPAVIGGFAAMAITALIAVPAVLLSRRDDRAGPRGDDRAGPRRDDRARPRGDDRARPRGDDHAGPRRGPSRPDPPGRPPRRGPSRRAALVLTALAAGSLPWFVPSLLHPVYVDPASVAAFAARADTPFGSVGSLLMLGGAWNAQTVPKGYGGAWSALWLAVVIAALAGYLLTARRRALAGWSARRLRWGGAPPGNSGVVPPGRRRWPGLGLAAAAGLVIAGLGVTAAGRDLLRSMIGAWPGFAVLRDAQQFVAPLALAEATGFGLVVAGAMNPGSFRRRDFQAERAVRLDAAGTMYAAVAILAPLLLLPGLAWGAAGRLRPAAYPGAWLAAARVIDASTARGSVLLLPWATYRTPPWNHGEVVLDPWTRLLSRPLIWNDGTQVGDVALAPDDPRARRLAGAIGGRGPLTAALRAAGVRFVLDDADGPDPASPRLPGAVTIIRQPGLTVYQLPGP